MAKKLNVFDKIKLSMDLDDPRRQNVELMEKVVNTIPTATGKKYALSKLLNNPEYGLTDPSKFKNQDYIKDIEDAWSLKHQEDYTPPDVEKILEKRNKEDAENFWNWNSDEHWTKKNVDELKRLANDAGYTDLAGYLDKVREIQTDKDTHKELDKNGMDVIQSIFTPRVYEARLRREDPTPKDYIGDVAENALYLLNPAGRGFRAGAQGIKMGEKLGGVANVVDVLANPLAMETLDALAYDDKDNTDRKDFSKADVAIGTAINAGMNKVMPYLIKNIDKLKAPVNKSKAQIKAEQAIKDNEPLVKGLTKEPITFSDLISKMDEEQARAYNLLNEDIIREKYPTTESKQKLIEMFEDKRKMLTDARDKYYNKKAPKTKFSERLLGDLDGWAGLDYASNKTGDKISEDPKLTRQLLTRTARNYVPFGGGQLIRDLARDYYNRKDKNVEQDKINRDIKALKLLGRRR